MIPTKVFFTSGTGTHKEDKNALDAASRDAGVGRLNLVQVSSILPPGIREITKEEFWGLVKPGEIVHAIHGVTISNVPGQSLTAAMGRARPWQQNETGYVTEIYGVPGIEVEKIEERVETMALQLFADENGVEGFAAEDQWVWGEDTYEVAEKKVKIDSIVASATCNMDGDYTAVMVLALLLP